MGTSDGQVGTLQDVVIHGPSSNLWNWVIVAEGYRQEDLSKFDNDVSELQNHIFDMLTGGHFAGSGCWERLNLYKLPVASTDRGADNDDPAGCGVIVQRATFFDAAYCFNQLQRWLTVDNGLVQAVVSQAMPEYDHIIVLVNGQISGGSGGPGGNCTVVATNTGGAWWFRAMHEIGHTAFGLNDEYHDLIGEPPPDAGAWVYPNTATAAELNMGNKWGNAIDAAIPVPTTVNQQCNHPEVNELRLNGTIEVPITLPASAVAAPLASSVGAFEGAGRYTCSLYRPQLDCRMRRNSSPTFCQVCTARIKQVLLGIPA